MRATVFIIALLGLGYALEYPIEFKYDYNARLALGIPELRSQFAAVGVKGTLVLQMLNRQKAVAKFEDLKVGEKNGDVLCEDRAPVPIPYKELQGHFKTLEEPCEVDFFEDEGIVMNVPKTDLEWMVNIRKSVLQLFRLDPIRGNIGQKLEVPAAPRYYDVEESTIMGRCMSQYSLTNYGVEFGKRVIPAAGERTEYESVRENEKSFQIIRTIDFDRCVDRVVVKHAGAGNLTKAGYNQFQNLQTRTSLAQVLVKMADPEVLRIEKAIVEGTITSNPFGFTTSKLNAISNMTLHLISVNPVKNPLKPPSNPRVVKTWAFELASPFARGSDSKLWVNYYNQGDKFAPFIMENVVSGMPVSESLVSNMMKEAVDGISNAVKELLSFPGYSLKDNDPSPWDTSAGKVLYYLDSAAEAIATLPYNKVQELFQKMFQDTGKEGILKQILVVDAAASTGSPAAIKVVLEYIKKSQISCERAASIFMTISNNALSPAIFPDLLEFVKSLDLKTSPFFASAAWVNFASLGNRVCLDVHTKKYAVPVPILGEENCRPYTITSDFLTFLEHKLTESGTKSWQRSVIVKAIGNIGAPESLPLMKRLAFGELETNIRVRSTAIFALTFKYWHKDLQKIIFEILMPIMENVKEPVELRQAALQAMLTWHPSPPWWHSLALLTWRDPSIEMASFVYFTIHNMAKSTDAHLARQSNIASFMLSVAKPFSPSQHYGYQFIWSRLDLPRDKMSTLLDISWMEDMESVSPREVMLFLYNSFGGFKVPIFEMNAGAEGTQTLLNKFKKAVRIAIPELPAQIWSKDPSMKRINEAMEKIKQNLDMRTREEKEFMGNVEFRLWDNIQHFAPINSDTIHEVASRFMKKLSEGEFHLTKYFNPVPLQVFLPTEVGLPLLTRLSTPTINMAEGECKVDVPGHPNPDIWTILSSRHFSATFNTNYKLITRVTSTMRAVAPWSQKNIETGVDSLKNINLPMKGRFEVMNYVGLRNISVEMEPVDMKKMVLAHVHNIPYTSMRSMWPSTDIKSVDLLRVGIKQDRSPLISEKIYLNKEKTGLDSYIEWTADVNNPLHKGYFLDLVQKPQRIMKLFASPVSKGFAGTLLYDASTSETKKFAFSVGFTSAASGRKLPKAPSGGIRRYSTENSEEHYYDIGAFARFAGSKTRDFRANVTLVPVQRSASAQQYELRMLMERSPLPGYDEQPFAFCCNTRFASPNIRSMNDLRRYLEAPNLETSFDGTMNAGKSCSQEQIVHFEGKLKLSEERRKLINGEVKTICNYDPYNPTVMMTTPAVYDTFEMKAEYKEDMPKQVMNATYRLYDLLQGFNYPHVYFNYMVNNPKAKLEVRARRPLALERWEAEVIMPTTTVRLDRMNAPYALVRLLPLYGLTTSESRFPALVVNLKDRAMCSASPEKVSTFEKREITAELSPCWRVILTKCNDKDDLIVSARVPKEADRKVEVQIMSRKSGVIVEGSVKDLQINGKREEISNEKKKILDKSGESYGYIYSESAERTRIRIRDEASIILSKKEVVVEVEDKLKGNTCGVCGLYKGRSVVKDMVGPQGCIYRSAEKFADSWTLPEGSGCNAQEVREKKKRNEEYRKTCEKEKHTPTFEDLRRSYGSRKEERRERLESSSLERRRSASHQEFLW